MAAVQKRAPVRALIVEDSPADIELMVALLKRVDIPLEYDAVDSPGLFEQRLREAEYDIILADYNMQTWTAIDALEILRKSGKDIPFIVVTGTLGDEGAVECLKQGAADYVLKDRPARLPVAVRRALQEKAERDERKQLEQQFLQSQKVEAIGQLAGGVAHDFNNLVTIISGYSHLLLEALPPDERIHGYVMEIQHAGERAAALTRQLLAFGRRQVLQPQVLDLNGVVANMDKMLRRLIGEDVDLVTACLEGLGRVKVDPGQIEQVIMNLAVNARDAMPRGGKLTLETANVELDEAYARDHVAVKPGPYVMLAVSDTGCGMDAETQKHIFEPFFTTKEQGKGTGLGLATVYGIVKQSGGNIWVYSEPGRGTTFKIYLPRMDEAVKMKGHSESPAATARGTETVLLVEDEDAVRTLVRGVLESSGYQVLEANGGTQALLISERYKKPIHLMLTDVVMSQMGGRELAEQLVGRHPETKVLYMSGYTDNAIVHHGVLDADTPFLQKPFAPDAVARKVREALDGEV